MLSATARVRAHLIAFDAHRILVLERFHRRVPAIGHVRVRGAVSRRVGRRAHAARDGFVIRERQPIRARAAETQIVHGPAARRRDALRRGFRQSAQNHVRDSLRGFDVAGRHRRWWARIHDAAERRDNLNRPQNTRRKRNLFRHQTAEHVHRRRRGHRQVRVHRPVHLRAGAGEIHLRALARQRHGNANVVQRALAFACAFQVIFKTIDAARQGAQSRAQHAFAVVFEFAHVALHARFAVLGNQFQKAQLAAMNRHQLRHQIPFPLHRRADVGQNHVEQRTIDFAALPNQNRRNPQAFLIDFARQRH